MRLRRALTISGSRLALALAALSCTTTQAASDAAEAAGLRARAVAAYEAADYGVYLQVLQTISRLRPNNPDIAIRIAAAQARNGHSDEAIAILNTIADMAVHVALAEDPRNAADFASLAGSPAWKAWTVRNDAHAAPLLTSTPVHTMRETDLLTEDIARDVETGDYYVTSILEHALIRIGSDGSEHRVPLAGPERNWNVLAVAIDSGRRRLWVSAQAIRGFPGIRKSDAGRAQLSVYDLRNGQRKATWAFRPKGALQASIGDIALAPNGDLLISDSEQGVVCRVDVDLHGLTVLAKDFVSPQDIAFSADGTLALVADYTRGIAVIDLASGVRRWLHAADGIALNGIDGLYAKDGDLIAIQNGLRPARVVRFHLDDAVSRVTGFDVLDRDATVLGDSTHGVIEGETFTYLANVGWNHIGDDGKVKPGETLTPAVLRRLSLQKEPVPPR